jgi:hypothetical protein
MRTVPWFARDRFLVADGGRILVSCYEYPLASVFSLFMGLCDTAGNLVFLQEGVGTSGWSRDWQHPLHRIPVHRGSDVALQAGTPGVAKRSDRPGSAGQELLLLPGPQRHSRRRCERLIAAGAIRRTRRLILAVQGQLPGEGAELLRLDSYTLREVLWAGDGSGALLTDGEGKLYWVPAGDGRASLLPVTGAECFAGAAETRAAHPGRAAAVSTPFPPSWRSPHPGLPEGPSLSP